MLQGYKHKVAFPIELFDHFYVKWKNHVKKCELKYIRQ